MFQKVQIKSGFSLVEIMVALSIFALLALPAYVMFSYSATEEVAYNKTAAANRLLESFRDEVKSLSYDEVDEQIKSGSNVPYNSLPPITSKVYEEVYDSTVNGSKVFENNELRLDLDVSSKDIDETKALSITATVKWKARGGSERKESLSFVKVK